MPIEMKAGLSLDKKEATLEIPSMPEAIKLTASELDEVIRHLAWIRAAMLPAHPAVDLTPDTVVSSVPAVRWQVAPDTFPAQFRHYLLHPGFGWVWIPMDQPNFDRMVEAGRMFLQAARGSA